MKMGTLVFLPLLLVTVVSGQGQDTTTNPPAKPYADVYGFGMVDMIYDFKQTDPNWFDTNRPSKLPNFKNEFGADGNWWGSVRQSRFGVKGYIPTSLGELKTIFEFDMFGVGVDAGQTTIRLRHAWGELGHFGGGQTYSPFMDIDVFPNTIEYWGPTGMVFFRNVQFRWTPWSSGDSNFMVALERPGASNDAGLYANRVELQGVKARFPMPDISGHYRLSGKAGHIQFSAILRRIYYDDLNRTATRDLSGSVTGWGAHISANWKLKKHVLRTSAVYGQGIQNYMNDAPADVGINNNFSNPFQPIVGRALPILGLVGYLDLNWSEKFTSSIGYSRVDIRNSSGQAADSYKGGQYASTNILYHPVKEALMGPEFLWGYKDNLGGWHTPDYRIQFSAKYTFSVRAGGD